MKLTSICVSITLTSILFINSFTILAADLTGLAKSALSGKASTNMPFNTNNMIKFAADKLGMPHAKVESSFGSLLKVAKDNLEPDSFKQISNVIPDTNNYLAKAPKIAKSSLNSLFSKTGATGKKAESLHYIDAAFKELGVPKKQLPGLVTSFSSYLHKNGYKDAASSLKKGLNFL